jgi:uncharacterized protein (AIM24 family)
MTTTTAPHYVCRYCRLPSDASALSCPHCGAPVNVAERVSASGWEEQPGVRDMARIQFGRSTCQIEGTSVPTADFGLGEGDRIYFAHHVLLWLQPSVVLEPLPMRGGWNRTLAGLPLVMLQARGPGHVALSQDAPGEIVIIPLQPGQQIDVREHRFLVASGNVAYDWFQSNVWFTTRSGDDTETHYPMGKFLDRFRADGAPGLLLLHAPGNTFVRDLVPNQTICIQPSALLYKDPGVGMQLHFEYPNTGGISWGSQYTNRTVWLRMWGPGRVAVQSVYERPESSGSVQKHSPATVQRW